MTFVEGNISNNNNSSNPTTKEGRNPNRWLRVSLVITVIVLLIIIIASLGASGTLRGSSRNNSAVTGSVLNESETFEQDERIETSEEEVDDDNDEDNDINPPDGINDDLSTMPNVGFLLSGYDLMYGNPLPTSASRGVLTSDPGFRLPIFESNFSNGVTTQDLRYLVPEGLSVRSCTGTCSLSFTSTLIESEIEYSNRLALKASVSGGGSKFGFKAKFKASADYERVANGINNLNEIVTQSEASCCAYFGELPLFDLPNYHPTFIKGLETLTEDYNEGIYRKFIDAFGTHFIRRGFMGAIYGEQSIISKKAQESFQSQNLDIRAAASASAFGITASASLQVENEKQLSTKFRQESIQRSVYSHGAPPPADGAPNTWTQQVIANPAPISIELSRIDTLPLPISDTVLTNLRKTLDNYCTILEKDGIIGSCELPKLEPPVIEEEEEKNECPTRANQFMITSCADWSLVDPVSCSGNGHQNCCYQNSCYSFDAGFSFVNDCVKTTCGNF